MALPERLPCARGARSRIFLQDSPVQGGRAASFTPSLPCVRGGAAQRRRGCKPCPISHYRATPPSLQPLSRPAAASSPCTGEPVSARPQSRPLHRGAGPCLCRQRFCRKKSTRNPHFLRLCGSKHLQYAKFSGKISTGMFYLHQLNSVIGGIHL